MFFKDLLNKIKRSNIDNNGVNSTQGDNLKATEAEMRANTITTSFASLSDCGCVPTPVCPICPTGPTGVTGAGETGATGMTGMTGANGLFVEFASDIITFTTFPGPTAIAVNLGVVTINVDELNNTVLITAYVTWQSSVAASTITFQIVRDEGGVEALVATAIDTSGGVAGDPITTSFIAVDDTPLTGSHTYTLEATTADAATFTIIAGTLTASEINT